MLREFKREFYIGRNGRVLTHEWDREGDGEWKRMGGGFGLAPTIDEAIEKAAANMEKWGWTLYDLEGNTLSGWKEF